MFFTAGVLLRHPRGFELSKWPVCLPTNLLKIDAFLAIIRPPSRPKGRSPSLWVKITTSTIIVTQVCVIPLNHGFLV